MRALLLLALALPACGACDDCFELELSQAAGWEPCCDYTRDNQQEPLLVRFTRTSADPYQAGVDVGCRWSADATPIQATQIVRDGQSVDVDAGINLDFDGAPVVLSVTCSALRPEPQYPQIVLGLLDPDLQAQYDPDGDPAQLVLVASTW